MTSMRSYRFSYSTIAASLYSVSLRSSTVSPDRKLRGLLYKCQTSEYSTKRDEVEAKIEETVGSWIKKLSCTASERPPSRSVSAAQLCIDTSSAVLCRPSNPLAEIYGSVRLRSND